MGLSEPRARRLKWLDAKRREERLTAAEHAELLIPASRRYAIDSPDVKQVRASFQLSQTEFARLIGISVKTLRNWEQGRRKPDGPARVLLQVAAKHPNAIWDVVRPDN